jgi:hypothetical protein
MNIRKRKGYRKRRQKKRQKRRPWVKMNSISHSATKVARHTGGDRVIDQCRIFQQTVDYSPWKASSWHGRAIHVSHWMPHRDMQLDAGNMVKLS